MNLKIKIMKYYYVIQRNINTGDKKLLLYNGSEDEQHEKFYCYKTKCGDGHSCSNDEFQNGYGCHSVKFKNKKQAIRELITKPDEFNNALNVIEKYGLMVVPKQKIVSYQNFHEIFK